MAQTKSARLEAAAKRLGEKQAEVAHLRAMQIVHAATLRQAQAELRRALHDYTAAQLAASSSRERPTTR
jgi:hypothetical protein